MTIENLERLLNSLHSGDFKVMKKKVRVHLDGGRKHDVTWRLNEDSLEFISVSAKSNVYNDDQKRVEFLAEQNAGMPLVRTVVEDEWIKAISELPTIGISKYEIQQAIIRCAREADRIEMALTGEDDL